MIGGEFDLSAGVSAITAGLTAALLSYWFSLNMWVGTLVALALLLLVGFINGYLVVKTGHPELPRHAGHVLRPAGSQPRHHQGTDRRGRHAQHLRDRRLLYSAAIFDWRVEVGSVTLRITVLWWFIFVALATWVLLRTRVGNWIYAVGGNAASARAVGVPVNRVKIGLFMTVGFLAWFVGQHRLYGYNTIQAGEGVGNEFLYIIAVVVGGRCSPVDTALRSVLRSAPSSSA